MLPAFFSFWPEFGAGLIAIAHGLAPVRLICSCKLRLRPASPTVGSPSDDRALLGLRRLHAGGAKTCSYEYRFAEYEYRFAEHEHEYEYDEIRCDART